MPHMTTLGLVLALTLALLAPGAYALATGTEQEAPASAPAATEAAPATVKADKAKKASSQKPATAKQKAATSGTKKSKKTKKSTKSAAKSRKPSALSQAAAAAASESSAEYAGLAPCYDFRPRKGKSRCEPQCIPYTRCRSGIMSCRLGHENGPLTWYACENRNKNTSRTPEDGDVLILDRDKGHGMPTGHAIFVEHAEPDGAGGYILTVSHTNYDRRCHLETTVLARYDPEKKTIDMRSGAWQDWGRNLKVAGFIRK